MADMQQEHDVQIGADVVENVALEFFWGREEDNAVIAPGDRTDEMGLTASLGAHDDIESGAKVHAGFGEKNGRAGALDLFDQAVGAISIGLVAIRSEKTGRPGEVIDDILEVHVTLITEISGQRSSRALKSG